jgi:hypothetical protein
MKSNNRKEEKHELFVTFMLHATNNRGPSAMVPPMRQRLYEWSGGWLTGIVRRLRGM